MKQLTKIDELYKIMKKDIVSGSYKIGDRLLTEFELMDKYNVARSTVREVLNILSTEGIVEKKHGLGSFIARIPATLGTIIVLVRFANLTTFPSSFWYANLVSKLNDYAKPLGYDILIAVGYGNTIFEIKDSIDNYFRKPFAKEIVAVVNFMSFDIGDLGAPIIALEPVCANINNSVFLDYEEIFNGAKKLFLEHGYDDITALYVDDNEDKAGKTTYYSLHKYINDFTSGDTSKQLALNSIDEAYDVFKSWYYSKNKTKAILIVDDAITESIVRFFYEDNISIPDDLAIITHANVDKTFNFPIQFHRFGFDADIAVKTLIKQLEILINTDKDPGVISLKPIYQEGVSL